MIVLLAAGPERQGALAEGEEHHLRVRRAREGDPVEVRDGVGLIGSGRLVRQDSGWRVDVETSRVVGRPPPLALAGGAGDRERFEWLVEKATELGATAVIPVDTEFTAAVATRVRGQHTPKLQRRALEALKQCGAAWVPEIRDPAPLIAVLAGDGGGHRWLADPAGDPPGKAPAPTTILIGPEGGLTAAERAAALAAGYRPVRLGPHVLRFETAAVAAAAIAIAARSQAEGETHG